MWVFVARFVGRWLVAEYGPRILATLASAVLVLVITVAYSISVMAQPGGIYWLASFASPEVKAQHPIAPVVMPGSVDPQSPPIIGNLPVTEPFPVLGNGTPGHWVDGPAYNQFDRSVWRTSADFAAWSPAACSAASLAWMLRAYGRPVAFLDDAVAMENPPFGISTNLGLMDHTGTQLAIALVHQGFSGFKLHINSTAELIARLHDGPLMMDGQRWFGVGHWFVAEGVDREAKGEAIGISVRESSGHNVTHLTWAQLYGAAGWSGWAVGIVP